MTAASDLQDRISAQQLRGCRQSSAAAQQMQALDRCLAEATNDENALTTALALLPTTVASLDAQQYNEVLTKIAAIDDDGTVAALTTPCIQPGGAGPAFKGARRVSNLCTEVPRRRRQPRRSSRSSRSGGTAGLSARRCSKRPLRI